MKQMVYFYLVHMHYYLIHARYQMMLEGPTNHSIALVAGISASPVGAVAEVFCLIARLAPRARVQVTLIHRNAESDL